MHTDFRKTATCKNYTGSDTGNVLLALNTSWNWVYGGRYQCADTSPTLTDCLWFLCTALGVVRGTQRIPNCTRWFLLSDWRVASVLGPGVTGACDVASVTSPAPCARLPQVIALFKQISFTAVPLGSHTYVIHVEMFVKSTVNTSNWYSSFCLYFLITPLSFALRSIARRLSRPTVACTTDHHWHSHGHYKNVFPHS
jgi:hypothetical protein